MGYSARYHIASLTAVFLALAIGILIGSQYGGDLLSSTRKDLEKSLTRDLDSARSEIKDLDRRVEWSNGFGTSVYPLLVGSRLTGQRFALVGLGDLPSEVTDAVEDAIEPTGGSLVGVGAVRSPPDPEDLADALGGTRFATIDRQPRLLRRFGHTFGRQLVTGGRILELSAPAALSQSSGEFGDLDGLVVYRKDDPDSGDGSAPGDRFDGWILDGAASTEARVIGVETLDTEPSGIRYFRDLGLSTVDNVDLPGGKLSLVYALNGAEGNFGVKPDATRQLPELLLPAEETASGAGHRPEKRG